MMEPFVTHKGKPLVLDWSDVNTDLIIPARYLKRIERTGYGPLLFADKRYLPGGAPPAEAPERAGAIDPAFPLNAPGAAGASILLVGSNFGCGSSREHAVWAVHQAGFRALIAPGIDTGFADIFEGNAFQNGLLPIELEPEAWRALTDKVRAIAHADMFINLEEQFIEFPAGSGDRVGFRLAEDRREKLLGGLDAIGETLGKSLGAIEAYEAAMPDWALPGAGREAG